jgi:hypothetical protein
MQFHNVLQANASATHYDTGSNNLNDGNYDLKKHKAGIQLAHIVLL